jgi:hypothetical protein
MLLKPTVPSGPLTVKDTVIIPEDSFVAIVSPVICEAVMFPLSCRITSPLLVMADTVEFVVRFEVVEGVGEVDGNGEVVGAGVEVEKSGITVIVLLCPL